MAVTRSNSHLLQRLLFDHEVHNAGSIRKAAKSLRMPYSRRYRLLAPTKISNIKFKRGRKFLITERKGRSIIRYIKQHRGTTIKEIIYNLDLHVSRQTVSRFLKREGYLYKRTKLIPSLNTKQKSKRMNFAFDHILQPKLFEITVFSDEKSLTY